MFHFVVRPQGSAGLARAARWLDRGVVVAGAHGGAGDASGRRPPGRAAPGLLGVRVPRPPLQDLEHRPRLKPLGGLPSLFRTTLSPVLRSRASLQRRQPVAAACAAGLPTPEFAGAMIKTNPRRAEGPSRRRAFGAPSTRRRGCCGCCAVEAEDCADPPRSLASLRVRGHYGLVATSAKQLRSHAALKSLSSAAPPLQPRLHRMSELSFVELLPSCICFFARHLSRGKFKCQWTQDK